MEKNLLLYKLGLTKEESSPTIVVFVSSFTVTGWSDLALQIKWLLPANDSISAQIGENFSPDLFIRAECRALEGIDSPRVATRIPRPGERSI